MYLVFRLNVCICCKKKKHFCFSEQLFRRAADLLVSEGYADLGYQYVIVDDCWLAKNRSEDGRLQADNKRFLNGIKALSDYVSTTTIFHDT